jgi:hypothetical protein
MPTRNRSSKSGKPRASRVRHSRSKQPVQQRPAAKKPGLTEAPRGKASKQSVVIAMLSEPAGVTVAAITAATGWQEHSVRGFFAAVVKRRLGLSLASEKSGGERVYRIENQGPAS